MLAAIGISAQAQIIIAPTTVNFAGQSGGVSFPNFQLAITYEVTESSGVYTYSYGLVTTPGEPLVSFTLGGITDPVNTQTVAFSNYGLSDPALAGVTANAIVFGWDFGSGVTRDYVSYTSLNGPTFATFTLNDDDIVWTSPASIPAPMPVPEAPTIFAAAMMILPFGVGAYRALRKERQIK